MTMNPAYKDLGSKKEQEEEEKDGDNIKFPKIPPSPPSRQWSSTFKNPRIVRVSRTFGGKDRHSKVCTVRGLRDRRIRLSVPTAIQLYDLQERLNLTQPSKVIDWLLDATKQEIDQLPPLPNIPTNFLHFNPNFPLHEPSSSSYVSDFLSPHLFKERERWSSSSTGIGLNQNDQENGEQNFFPLNSDQFSVPNMHYKTNYFNLEPPNLSLSQFGGGFDHDHQEQSSSSRASSSQIYMSDPSAAAVPSHHHFHPYFAQSLEINDHDYHFRQSNSHLQNPSSLHNLINSPMKSFSLDAEKEDRDNKLSSN